MERRDRGGAKDLRRAVQCDESLESVATTVLGGVILWSVTGSMSQPAATTDRMAVAIAPAAQPTPIPFDARSDFVAANPGNAVNIGSIEKSEAAVSNPNSGFNNIPSLAPANDKRSPCGANRHQPADSLVPSQTAACHAASEKGPAALFRPRRNNLVVRKLLGL